MARVFLDANVLFSAAYRPESRLRELWGLRETELVTSELAVEEARRNLLAYGPDDIRRLAELTAQLTVVPSAPARLTLAKRMTLPESDLLILSAAAAANCTHLLTGDKRHFGPLYGRKVGGVLVLPPGEYLRSRRS